MPANVNKKLRYNFYVIVDEFGSVRVTKREGKLAAGERSVGMTLLLPEAVFRTPLLRATVEVPDTGQPGELTASVVAAAETQIRAATGLEVVLTAVKRSDDEP